MKKYLLSSTTTYSTIFKKFIFTGIRTFKTIWNQYFMLPEQEYKYEFTFTINTTRGGNQVSVDDDRYGANDDEYILPFDLRKPIMDAWAKSGATLKIVWDINDENNFKMITGNFTLDDIKHDYGVPDIYTIKLTSSNNSMPNFTNEFFKGNQYKHNELKLISINSNMLKQIIQQGNASYGGFVRAFYDCLNLESISEDIFALNIWLEDYAFDSTFLNCKSLTQIPENIFKNNKLVRDYAFHETFRGSGITNIPTDLFRYNRKVAFYGFAQCFMECNIVTIPAGLFKHNTKVSYYGFGQTFYNCSNLRTIPYGLFSNNRKLSDYAFYQTFAYCSSLKSIPNLLFNDQYNIGDYAFYQTFYECTSLTLNPNMFCINKRNRFKTIKSGKNIFYQTFYRTSFNGEKGIAPTLWSYKYETNIADHSQCFGGDGNNIDSLNNYKIIPMSWGARGNVIAVVADKYPVTTYIDGINRNYEKYDYSIRGRDDSDTGMFILFGHNNTYRYSYDGIHWKVGEFPVLYKDDNKTIRTDQYYENYAYNDDTLVIIPSKTDNSLNTTSMASNDGINWYSKSLGKGSYYGNWGDVTYFNNKFYITSNKGYMAAYTGKDDSNWDDYSQIYTLVSQTTYLKQLTATDKIIGIYEGVDKTNSGLYLDSDNEWKEIALPSSNYWTKLIGSNGKYVLLAKNSITVAYSYDGIQWYNSTSAMPLSLNWNNLTYGNGKFVALAANSDKGAYSTNGITWSEISLPMSGNWVGLTFGLNRFIAVDNFTNKYISSTDAINWNVGDIVESERDISNSQWLNMAFMKSFVKVNDVNIPWSVSKNDYKEVTGNYTKNITKDDYVYVTTSALITFNITPLNAKLYINDEEKECTIVNNKLQYKYNAAYNTTFNYRVMAENYISITDDYTVIDDDIVNIDLSKITYTLTIITNPADAALKMTIGGQSSYTNVVEVDPNTLVKYTVSYPEYKDVEGQIIVTENTTLTINMSRTYLGLQGYDGNKNENAVGLRNYPNTTGYKGRTHSYNDG